ncbi:MAG: hypothetical protein LBH44_10240 [Treponema sp.]|jgi:hypothetical protein|nr:hypothetical protein [Treponema sp.]
MSWAKWFAFFCIIPAFLLTCGIDEYYYLPQVPQDRIQVLSNSSATIRIPSLSSSQYFYASHYSIYYRIYMSGLDVGSSSIQLSNNYLSGINSYLWYDYNSFQSSTDPTNTAVNTGIATMYKNRGYYELELRGDNIRNILSPEGGTLYIEFPSQNLPFLTCDTYENGKRFSLYRTTDGGIFTPNPDRYFYSSDELSKTENIDVQNFTSSGSFGHAYVSMYIIAVGVNPEQLTAIYSKPTHVSIFKLPSRSNIQN